MAKTKEQKRREAQERAHAHAAKDLPMYEREFADALQKSNGGRLANERIEELRHQLNRARERAGLGPVAPAVEILAGASWQV